MKTQNIYVSVLIIVAAILIGIWLGHREVAAPTGPSSASISSGTPAADDSSGTGDKSFTLSCDGQKEMMVTFHLPADQSVDVMLSDGRTMSLDNTSTDQAASYTSADGSTTLSLSGSTLTLAEAGAPTYANCVLDASATGAAM